MNDLVEKLGGLPAAIVFIALCLNIVLSATAALLDKIKDLTPSDADNKAVTLIGKIVTVLKKVIDFLSANKAHK